MRLRGTNGVGALVLPAVLLLQGCLTISTTDQSGVAITQAARGDAIQVHVTDSADDVDLVAFDFRLAYDPTKFEDPVCLRSIAAHNLFTVTAPVTDGAIRFVRILSLGTSIEPIAKGTQITVCEIKVRSDAAVGSTELRTMQSHAATAPPAPGQVGALRTYGDHVKAFTVI
jgi:hypothetical protein